MADGLLADFGDFMRVLRDLAAHGVVEFDPERPQSKNFRVSRSFLTAVVQSLAQRLDKPDPLPFRDCVIEAIIASLTNAYAQTSLNKEQLGERLKTVYLLVAEPISASINHWKPPDYEQLLKELGVESLGRPARIRVPAVSAEEIAKKLEASKSRMYA